MKTTTKQNWTIVEVYNTSMLMGLRICLSRQIYNLRLLFCTRALFDDFNYANKRAEVPEKNFSCDQIQFMKKHRSSNTSVSVTTIKPLSAKNGFQL